MQRDVAKRVVPAIILLGLVLLGWAAITFMIRNCDKII
jgi:hypothetical protein